MNATQKPPKPLGGKVYGSIPHLLGSKLGPGDHHIHEGQHRIATEKTRDKHDLVIVQEKYDGSNVAITKLNGEILALTRVGYLASTSPWEQHRYFAKWVEKLKDKFDVLLSEGDRVCGEWLMQAHGIKYEFSDNGGPLVLFDYFSGVERLSFHDFYTEVIPITLFAPVVLPRTWVDKFAIGIDEAQGIINAEDPNLPIDAVSDLPEGLIYRIERKGKLDFIAKWVRPDFETGKYLPEISGNGPVWNYDPKLI